MRSRRWFWACCVVLVLAFNTFSVSVRAQVSSVYFPATGHNLNDPALSSFWQTHDGTRLLGFPVTEAFGVDGVTVQYFERGRLEARTDPTTNAVSVQTGAVGAEYAVMLGRRFAPATTTQATHQQLVALAGHTVRAPFLSFWQAAGGTEFFGAPISETLWETTDRGQRRVQYFERARLEQDATMAGTPDEIVVGSLGLALAQMQQLNTAATDNLGGDVYGPGAASAANVVSLDATPTPLPTAVPSPVPAPRAVQPSAAPRAGAAAAAKPAAAKPVAAKPAAAKPATRQHANMAIGGKYIVVDLSEQWMYAFQDGKQVLAAPVSTGRNGMDTPTGNFAIYAKLKSQTMDGVLDGVPWKVPNVPNVMYINGGVALHGTYWHNAFGTGRRLSHGCVNLPLRAAAWLYDWAPVGTPVRVMY